MLDRSLDSDRRRTDEEAQLGNCALAFRLRQDRDGLNRMQYREHVDCNRRRLGMRSNADYTGSGVAGDRGVRMVVDGFCGGHKQEQGNAAQRDQPYWGSDSELPCIKEMHQELLFSQA